MHEVVRRLLAPFNRGLLLDSNLLLLLAVGRYDPRLIGGYKRTVAFTVEEFVLLAKIVGAFKALVTTPNVLTEVSNLAGQLPGSTRTAFYATLRSQVEMWQEAYVPSQEVMNSESFAKLGLTDAAIRLVGSEGALVLSVDFPLVGTLQHAGVAAINFNHLRSYA